jgi:hypothetical protein
MSLQNCSVWQPSSKESCRMNQRPNPSVERTANGGPPLFASAAALPPLPAAHVKR